MANQTLLKRILASLFIVAGGAAIAFWAWPDEAIFALSSLELLDITRMLAAALAVGLGLVVLASVWRE